jgi:GWxTD domain-containing protein
MKRLLTIFAIFLSTVTFGQQLKAYFDVKKYDVPGDVPYVDVNLSIIGNSVKYNSDSVANIEATLIIKSGKKIIDFRKSLIQSPKLKDGIKNDFLNVQRFSLKNGKYELQVLLRDINVLSVDTIKQEFPFEIYYSGNNVEFSDIELVEKYKKIDPADDSPKNLYAKAGYHIYPFVSNYYPKEFNTIALYAEIYNTNLKFGKDNKYVTIVQITDEGRNVIGNHRKTTVQTGKSVNVVLTKFDIEKLYSGTYLIDIEIRNSDNEFIANNSIRFYRNKMLPMDNYSKADSVLGMDVLFTQLITNRDTLIDHIKSMRPTSDMLERSIIDKQIQSATTDELQQFMYNFWVKRDEEFPQLAWDRYYDQVLIVNADFSTHVKKGYETDRGRVYLQYGKPNNHVKVTSEPNAYPYEIWHYYHIGNLNNKRFVFYNRDLSTNDYELLHSDMTGEKYNRQWDLDLHSRTSSKMNSELENSVDKYGSRALDYYNNPR